MSMQWLNGYNNVSKRNIQLAIHDWYDHLSDNAGQNTAVPVMETDQRICLPAILLNRKMPNQSASGTGPGASTDHADMADSALVSSAGFDGNQEINTDTSDAGSVGKSQGRDSSLISQGSLNLAAWLVSGDLSRQKEFQKQHQSLFSHLGEVARRGHTHRAGGDGRNGVQSVNLKPFVPL